MSNPLRLDPNLHRKRTAEALGFEGVRKPRYQLRPNCLRTLASNRGRVRCRRGQDRVDNVTRCIRRGCDDRLTGLEPDDRHRKDFACHATLTRTGKLIDRQVAVEGDGYWPAIS